MLKVSSMVLPLSMISRESDPYQNSGKDRCQTGEQVDVARALELENPLDPLITGAEANITGR